jgi:fructose-1-phosphate kinase PfkB-like protein
VGPFVKMSAAGVSTVVVGLNGALQKRFVLPSGGTLIPGNVHRAEQIQIGVGGKGQDVAVTLSCLGYSQGLQLAQFVGTGPEGDQVYDLLVNMLGEEAMTMTIRPENSGMRTCTSIIASDSTTELVEPSGTILDDEINELLEKLRNRKEKVSALCFMGSMPPGCPDSMYADIYKTVADPSTLCVIDSMSGLVPLIQVIADMKLGSTVFKVNASELCRLASVNKSNSEAGGVATVELIESIQQFLVKYPASRKAFDAIAITDGAHPAYLADLSHSVDNDDVDDTTSFHLFQLPIVPLHTNNNDGDDESKNPSVLFPIGAGDSVAAGLLAAWKCLVNDSSDGTISPCLPDDISAALKERNQMNKCNRILTSFAFGLACGSASCLEEGNSVVQRTAVLDLFRTSDIPALYFDNKQATLA